MPETTDLLSNADELLSARFQPKRGKHQVFPSDAGGERRDKRLERAQATVLPDDMRSKMPFTKEKYLVKEHPLWVFWERETRKFLRRLSPDHGHRVSAVMVYEWATGLQVAELERQLKDGELEGKAYWRTDTRFINKVLRYYFGKPYSTWIAGKKVPNAYKVRPGYYITRHRPNTLELYAQYCEGTLEA